MKNKKAITFRTVTLTLEYEMEVNDSEKDIDEAMESKIQQLLDAIKDDPYVYIDVDFTDEVEAYGKIN